MDNHAATNAHQGQHRTLKLCQKKGCTLYTQDDKATSWIEILSGAVRTSRLRADGQRRVTGFYFAGDVIGIDKTHRHENAETLTDSILACHLHSQAHPGELPPGSQAALQRALESAQASLFLLGRASVMERLAAFLVSIATRVGTQGQLPLPMGGDDIADYLGMSPQTLSRAMKDLQRTGIIIRPKRHIVQILKAHALLTLAGEEWPDETLGDDGWLERINPAQISPAQINLPRCASNTHAASPR